MVSYLLWQGRQLSEPPTAARPRGPNIRASIYRVSQSKIFPASLCSYKFVWSFNQMAYFPGNFTQNPRKIGCYPSIATIVALTSITMSPVIVEMSDTGTGWQVEGLFEPWERSYQLRDLSFRLAASHPTQSPFTFWVQKKMGCVTRLYTQGPYSDLKILNLISSVQVLFSLDFWIIKYCISRYFATEALSRTKNTKFHATIIEFFSHHFKRHAILVTGHGIEPR